MKNKLILCFLITIISPLSSSLAQFPLEIGNRWDYAEGWWDGSGNKFVDTVTYTVISDTLLQNGKSYYKVIPENLYFFKQLMRADSSGIYFYDINCGKEWLYYSYKLPVGSYTPLLSFFCDTTDAPKMYKQIDSTEIVFSKTERYMKFSYEGGIDNFYSVGLTLSYGFIDFYTSSPDRNYYSNLLGCKLSGNIYGTLTSIQQDEMIIENYWLRQNFPNPFNPSTHISWHSPVSGHQTLKVYDVLGIEVVTLVNELREAGTYEIEFNTHSLTEAGNYKQLSSGVYFYRFQAGDFVQTKKMILLR
jgi:hypothetical protein